MPRTPGRSTANLPLRLVRIGDWFDKRGGLAQQSKSQAEAGRIAFGLFDRAHESRGRVNSRNRAALHGN